jgi:FAD/FMN-containing dehydrogenase
VELFPIAPPSTDLSPHAGSEGTVATVTEATVSLEPIPATASTALRTDDDVIGAMEDVAPILEHDPAVVGVMDDVLLDLARDTAECANVVGLLLDGTDAVTDLVIEYGGSVSGEHGDGRARTQWNRNHYPGDLWATLRERNSAFDAGFNHRRSLRSLLRFCIARLRRAAGPFQPRPAVGFPSAIACLSTAITAYTGESYR